MNTPTTHIDTASRQLTLMDLLDAMWAWGEEYKAKKEK